MSGYDIYGPCERCGSATDHEGECPTCRDFGGTDRIISHVEPINDLIEALEGASHALNCLHGLMAYDDATAASSAEHFRIDNSIEISAIDRSIRAYGEPRKEK